MKAFIAKTDEYVIGYVAAKNASQARHMGYVIDRDYFCEPMNYETDYLYCLKGIFVYRCPKLDGFCRNYKAILLVPGEVVGEVKEKTMIELGLMKKMSECQNEFCECPRDYDDYCFWNVVPEKQKKV